MRGRVNAIRTFKGLVADLRINKLMLNKARIYAAIDNLATFTSYPFMDPEVGNMAGDNILSTGIDYGTYPSGPYIQIWFKS